MGSTPGALLDRAMSAFLPPELRAHSDAGRRARILTIFSLVLVPVIALRSASLLWSGEHAQAATTALVLTIAAAAPVLMQKTRSVALAGHALTLALFIAGTRFAFARGGLGSPPLIALGALPLIATFLCGPRAGGAWTAIVLAEVGVFAVLRAQGVLLVDRVAPHRFWLEVSGALLFPLVILGLALAYDWSRTTAVRAQADAELERARAEQESSILRADRMAAMGQLAAGIAHEANNPLGYVSANLEFAEQRLQEADEKNLDQLRIEVAEALAEARQGTDRIARVVRDLKVYSRQPGEASVDVVAIPQVLESALKMVRNELRHRAQVIRSYDEVPLALADETRLTQVFVNLLLNAAQALPDGRAHQHRVEVHVRSPAPNRVEVEIVDTGEGIPAENLARVTEPFFTTKPPDVGTGLGLSVVSTIVRALDGELAIESSLGHGTTVRVTLPAAPADSPRRTRAAPEASASLRPLRLLLIDDDPLGLRAIRRMLRQHDVTAVESGRDAIAKIAAGERYDAVLCDVMMPDLTGVDVHDRIAELAPAIAHRMVFLTGGVFFGDTATRFAALPNLRLDKPVDPVALAAALERVIAPTSSGTRTRVPEPAASTDDKKQTGSGS